MGGGRVGVIDITPLHTSASAVRPFLSPTNGTPSSTMESYADPVIMSLRILPGGGTSVTFPVSSVGTLITAPVEFTLLLRVKGNPTYPNVAQYILPTLRSHGRMCARTGPNSISL